MTLFRVNSSSRIGIGHLMRCLTLAEEYPNSQIVFACENHKGNLNKKILEHGYKLVQLGSNSEEELCKLIETYAVNLLVIDSYDIDYEFEKKIKERTNVQILSFDDNYKRHYCDILLNHNICAIEKKYKKLVPKTCEVRCGKQYTLIRNEFKEIKNNPKIQPAKNKTIFICMGGADHSNINIDILKAIEKIGVRYNVNLATTSANENLSALKEFCDRKENINLHVNSENIARLMCESSVAIVSPSVVAHEILFMGLPFIAVQTAENQKDMYKYLKKNKHSVMKKFKMVQFIKMLKMEFLTWEKVGAYEES